MSSKNVIMIVLENTCVEVASRWYINSVCYGLKPLGLDNRTTLVLSNTRELDRVPSTKYSTLYTNSHGPC